MYVCVALSSIASPSPSSNALTPLALHLHGGGGVFATEFKPGPWLFTEAKKTAPFSIEFFQINGDIVLSVFPTVEP